MVSVQVVLGEGDKDRTTCDVFGDENRKNVLAKGVGTGVVTLGNGKGVVVGAAKCSGGK